MIYKESLFVPCECGCTVIEFSRFDDEPNTYLSCYASSFYSKQSGIWDIVRQRIKAAWFMLTGKEYQLYDVILSGKQFIDLCDSLFALALKEVPVRE